MKVGLLRTASRANQGRARTLGAVMLVASAFTNARGQTVGYTQILPAPGYTKASTNALSANGKVVWGYSVSSGNPNLHWFRWTAESGRVDVLTPPGLYDAYVASFSEDGSVGAAWVRPTASSSRGGRYSTDRGFELLPLNTAYRQSTSQKVTQDGQTFAGKLYDPVSPTTANSRVYLWNESSGFRLLPRVGEADEQMFLGGMSNDASVVYGYTEGLIFGRAWKWTAATGTVQLPGLNSFSEPDVLGCSRDGKWAVGVDVAFGGGTLVRWDSNGQIQNLGRPASISSASASYVSNDGSVIAGNGQGVFTPGTDVVAIVWTEELGSMLLIDYLRSYGLALPEGTVLGRLSGMSSDGQTFSGYAISPEGMGYGYVATIPTPSVLPVVGLTIYLLTPRRRR